MRIIAGSAKGHLIYAPKGLKTRPTTDRVRESLFNILQPTIIDTHVLDLFAGTGALGIEALSRGAKYADFVDSGSPAIGSIKRNLLLTKLENQASVYHSDAIAFLKNNRKRYDLIFLDPPYDSCLVLNTLVLLQSNLEPSGIVIVETNNIIEMPKIIEGFMTYRKSKYGDSVIWFYKYA